jgi:hypothetical protein
MTLHERSKLLSRLPFWLSAMCGVNLRLSIFSPMRATKSNGAVPGLCELLIGGYHEYLFLVTINSSFTKRLCGVITVAVVVGHLLLQAGQRPTADTIVHFCVSELRYSGYSRVAEGVRVAQQQPVASARCWCLGRVIRLRICSP